MHRYVPAFYLFSESQAPKDIVEKKMYTVNINAFSDKIFAILFYTLAINHTRCTV